MMHLISRVEHAVYTDNLVNNILSIEDVESQCSGDTTEIVVEAFIADEFELILSNPSQYHVDSVVLI